MGEKRSKTDSVFDDPAAALGCAYILDTASAGQPVVGPPAPTYCGAPCRSGSDYCAAHHAMCHLRPGSGAETRQLQAIDAVADIVGGRQGKPVGEPPPAWLRRVEAVARPFFRPKRSCYVQEGSVMHSAKRKPASQIAPNAAGETAPSPERQQHGPIERPDRPIADVAGRPARPYRAIDTLAIMERRGSITAAMRQAGEDFRARFAVAQLDPLRAIDLSHLRLGERSPRPEAAGPGLRIEAARAMVWRAVQAVGGFGSPAGSCLWHVVGWERPLKEWALGQGWSGRRVSQESAAGILIAALGALESHFGGTRSLPKTHFSLDKSGLM
jgi:hypothetical protein